MKKIVGSAFLICTTTFVLADEPKIVNDSNTTKPVQVESSQNKRVYNTGMKLGTLGLGVDISTPINDKLSARFNLNGATYTDTQEEDDNEFEGTLDLLTAGVLLDYYPFENNFRLSTGVYYNGNGFDGNIRPTATTTIEIGDKEYRVDELGSLDTKIVFDKVAPYVGLGWGNDAHDKGWGFTFDLGVMYHGEAKGSLTPKDISPSVDKDLLNENIDKEEQDINDDLSDFNLYPVVALGINYSF
jgi:hypothetical protein